MPDADFLIRTFTELSWARARLWEHGDWIGHAVDPLQAWAFEHGLVGLIGQDAVQAIMADAFGKVRDDV